MKKEAIKRWINEVYEKLCALLSLYEETNCFQKVPDGEEDKDFEEFLNRKFRELDHSVSHYASYMDDEDIAKLRKTGSDLMMPDEKVLGVMGRLQQIVRDVQMFATTRRPSIIEGWEMFNWNLIYFDKIFDLMEEYPETYKEILIERKLQKELEQRQMRKLRTDAEKVKELREFFADTPIPGAELIAERTAYFEKIRERNEQDHVICSKERIFQEELLNTMKSLFEKRFKEYQENPEERYRRQSDDYLRAGDCLAAVQVLMDGIRDTGSPALAEREAYLRENIKGYETRYESYTFHENPGYKEGWVIEYEYDESWNMVKEIRNYEPSNMRDEIWYDASGKVERWDHRDHFGNEFRKENVHIESEYEYDEDGREVKTISYRESGDVDGYTEYEYDASGNRMKEAEYDADGQLLYILEFEYDEYGKRTRVFKYDEHGHIFGRTEYKYDAAGNMVEEAEHPGIGDMILRRMEYEYDESGNMTKEVSYDASGKISQRFEYEYTILGDKIGLKTYDRDGKLDGTASTTYIYRYTGQMP